MSTKIYNAYLTDTTNVFQIVKTLKQAFTNERKIIEAEKLAEMIYNELDTNTLNNTKHEIQLHVFYDTVAKLKQNLNKDGDYTVFGDPFQCEFSFVEHPDNNNVIVKLFCSDDNYVELLEKIAEKYGWEDFHYQNSTDAPDYISEDEWNNRRDVWNRLLPIGTSFNDIGPTLKIGRNKYPLIDIFWDEDKEIMNFALKNYDKRKRLEKLVNIVYWNSSRIEKVEEKFSFVNALKMVKVFENFVSSESNQDLLKSFKTFSIIDLNNSEIRTHSLTTDIIEERLLNFI